MNTGYEVCFSTPIKKSVQVETNDVPTAIDFAIDYEMKRNPSLNWGSPKFEVYPINYDRGTRTTITPIYKS